MFERRWEGVGGFDLALKATTPFSILDVLDITRADNQFGHIVITPGRVSSLDPLTVARYTGILRERSDDGLQLSGPGIEAWLSDEDDIGALKTTATSASKSFEDWWDFFDAQDLLNGLTLGDIEALGGSYKLVERRGLVTVRPLIDRLSRLADAEWRVNPDGTIDAGTDLHGAPTAVLLRGGGGREVDVVGLPVSSWGDTIHNETVTTGVWVPYPVDVGGVVVDDAAFESSTVVPTSKRLDGANLRREKVIDGNDSADDAPSAEAIADKEQARSGTSSEFAPSVDVWDAGETVQPGATVYAYDPPLGLYDLANHLVYRGRDIFPVTMRVHAVRQRFRRGMGCHYRAPDAAGTYTDLSDWIEPEDGDASLEVGAARRRLVVTKRRGEAA